MTGHPPPPTGDAAMSEVRRAISAYVGARMVRACEAGKYFEENTTAVNETERRIDAALRAHLPPPGSVVLAPDAARAVAALIAAGDEWRSNLAPFGSGSSRTNERLCDALADPALAAVRRMLAGNDTP